MQATKREELAQNILNFAKLTNTEKRLKFLQKHIDEIKLINQLDSLYTDEMKDATSSLVNSLIKNDNLLNTSVHHNLLTHSRLKLDKEKKHTLSKTSFEFQHVFHLLGRIDSIDSFVIKGRWDLLSPYIQIQGDNISSSYIKRKLLSINTKLNKLNAVDATRTNLNIYTDEQKQENIRYRNAWIDLLGLLDNSRKMLNNGDNSRYQDVKKYFKQPFNDDKVLIDVLKDQNITDSITDTTSRVFTTKDNNELAAEIQSQVFDMLKEDNIKSKSFLGATSYYTESELIDLLFDRQLDVKQTVDKLTQFNIEDTNDIKQNKQNNIDSQQNETEILELINQHQQLIIKNWVKELNNVITLVFRNDSLISNFTIKGYKYTDVNGKATIYDFDESEIKLTTAKVNKLVDANKKVTFKKSSSIVNDKSSITKVSRSSHVIASPGSYLATNLSSNVSQPAKFKDSSAAVNNSSSNTSSVSTHRVTRESLHSKNK